VQMEKQKGGIKFKNDILNGGDATKISRVMNFHVKKHLQYLQIGSTATASLHQPISKN
jgi:hypothetical protein